MNLSHLHDKIIRSVRTPVANGQPDKRHETDRQMLLRVARQFALLFVVILLLDDIIDFVIEVMHFLFELLHLLIEVIEGFVEEVLEHLLHTGHHASETIIVNVVLVVVIYGLYRLYRAWPHVYRRLKRKGRAAWLRGKRRKYDYWLSLSPRQKIKLTAAYAIGIALMLFWLTL